MWRGSCSMYSNQGSVFVLIRVVNDNLSIVNSLPPTLQCKHPRTPPPITPSRATYTVVDDTPFRINSAVGRLHPKQSSQRSSSKQIILRQFVGWPNERDAS
jgi:hypothetical protein